MQVMLTPTGLIHKAIDRLRAQDPERDALRRAARAAITVPVAAVFTLVVVGGTEAPLVALLGAFWLMVVADFPGNRQNRAVAYLGLGFNGMILLTLGTAVAPIAWLSVTLMFVLGVAVSLAGVVSETVSAGQRVMLLLYVFPASTPGGPIAERLLGWLIALAICVPATLFLLPPRHHSQLRRHATQACSALADRLDGIGSPADVTSAMDALRANFFAASFRPVGLTAGSRALVRVVDDLELISERLDDDTGRVLGPMKQPAIDVLRCCARVLDVSRVTRRGADRVKLDLGLSRLRSVVSGRYRDDVQQIVAGSDETAAWVGRRLLIRHTITTTIELTGSTIAAAAAADARPVWARVLGVRLPDTGAADRLVSEPKAIAAIPTGFLKTRSVAARNALRTGIGLALAVAVTHLFPAQHGFWVVLGTIVVLGSSALSTGTRLIRAVVGTAVGVTLGAVLIAVFGTAPAMLWCLLPIAVFGSAYLPRVSSFAVGQASIAMTVLIILNLIAPTGWQIGLLRIEDVTYGALVGVVVSLLLWPRGATAAVSAVIGAALELNSRYLHAAVLRVTRGTSRQTETNVEALSRDALVASRTVDDAVRHYLSETGNGANLRTPVIRAANRATRLRIAADVIADQTTLPPPSAYPRTRSVLEAHAESVAERLTRASVGTWHPISDELVRTLRAEATRDAAAVDAALPLVTVAANLGELELIYPTPTESLAA
jgi:Fusaric acid resistance protein-like